MLIGVFTEKYPVAEVEKLNPWRIPEVSRVKVLVDVVVTWIELSALRVISR